MAYDGNGTFVRTHNWTQDAANGVDINATSADQEDNGFAAGLSLAVTRDGQGKMATDFLPNADNTLNLGTSGRRWASINGLPINSIVSGIYYAQTAAEAAASVIPTAFTFMPWRGEDIRRFGAVGDGATDNRAFLATANSVGAALYFPPGTYAVASNLTLNVPCIFDLGAILKPAAGITITINAPVNAGPWQIFNVSNAGAIVTGNLQNPFMYGEWWGAKGDNTTDDTAAFNAASICATASSGIPIQMLAKTYKWSGQVLGCLASPSNSNAVPFWGASAANATGGTTVNCTANGGVAALKYKCASGNITPAEVRDIYFTGDTSSIGIEFSGMDGMRAVRCRLGTLAEGIRFHNETSTSFTEFCVAQRCNFESTCVLPMRYKKLSTSTSFNCSGMIDRCVVRPTGNAVLQVDSGCLPYNAPLDVEVYASGASTLVSSASNVPNANFHGTLTIEISGGTFTLATGQPVYFTGSINALGITTTTGANLLGGTLVRCRGVTLNADSSSNIISGERNYRTQMAVGSNTLQSAFPGYHRLIQVHLTAANHDYLYTLAASQSGSGATTCVAVLATLNAFNNAGIGGATFTTDTSGNVIVTNGNAGFVNVLATWSEVTISTGGGNTNLQF